MLQQYLMSSIMFIKLIVTIVTVYIFSALVLSLIFIVMQKAQERKRSQLSDKYTAAFAMIYMVERLHGRRMNDTRDRVLRAIWDSDSNW